MEFLIFIAAAVLLLLVWQIFFNKKSSDQAEQAPYKVETPESKPALDPVAVALDLEPIVLTPTVTTEETKPKRTRTKKLDVNKDGKVNLKDAKAAIKKVTKTRKTRSKKS